MKITINNYNKTYSVEVDDDMDVELDDDLLEEDDDDIDPYVSGGAHNLKPPIVPSGIESTLEVNSPSRTKYEREKTSPMRTKKQLSKPALAIAAASKNPSSIVMSAGGTSAVLKKGGVFVRAPSRTRKSQDLKGSKSTISSAASSS